MSRFPHKEITVPQCCCISIAVGKPHPQCSYLTENEWEMYLLTQALFTPEDLMNKDIYLGDEAEESA